MATFPTAILSDRVAMVKQAPSMVHLWHGLYQDTKLLPKDQRKVIDGQVRALARDTGWSAFLANTFLFAVNDDLDCLAAAGRILRSGNFPVDAGQAWLNTSFASALRSGATGDAFVAHLRSCEFADVTAFTGRQLLAREAVPSQLPRLRAGTPRRVAVVVPNLSSRLHAPTDMALKHCAALARSGLQVGLFSTQEFRMQDMPGWLGVPRTIRLGPVPANGWPGLNLKMNVVVASEKLSMGARWRSLMAQIRKYAPDVALYIGSFSPLMAALHREYPLAALGTNTVTPIGPLDVWLAPRADAVPAWSPQFEVGRVWEHSKRFSLDLAEQATPREQLGVPEDAVLWVTSGTRLAAEVRGEWLEAMLQALQQHPHCHWLIVGDGHDRIEGLPANHSRVHTRKFEPQLSALVKACDLYLNPPRMGSGYTVADAMAHGLAVLTLPGGDGADKTGPWTQPDMQSYLRMLGRLSADPQARAQFGRELQQRFAAVFDLNEGAAGLVDAMGEAARLAARRPA